MEKKRVLILGAGISGLATAWYLNKSAEPLDIVILEKSSRVGGWMHTDHTTGFHFEKGPRTFKVSKCPKTMQLIKELKLEEEVIWSDSKPHHRYLWLEDELHRFPTNPLSFLFSPLTKGFLRALLTEWKKPIKNGDETVWEFVLRRFNYDVARLLFDPMVVGIFGGDIRTISVRACFPKLKEWEEKYGSMTKGFYRSIQEKKKQPKFSSAIPNIPLSALFSFRSGIDQLPQSIATQLPSLVHFNQEVKGIAFQEDQVIAKTDTQQYAADFLICALPVKEAGQLFEPHAPDIAKELLKIPCEGIAVVNFGYDAEVLPCQGFGYLTPTYTQEEIMGVVFDSSVFFEHNRKAKETRLTIKMGESNRSEEDYIESALKGIRRHLGISRMPNATSFKMTKNAIPQYGVGHLDKMAELHANFRTLFPNCALVGNYLQGVSVESCIEGAQLAAQNLIFAQ